MLQQLYSSQTECISGLNFFSFQFTNSLLSRYISDALAECDPSQPESVRDEEEAIVEEQKDEGKLGFCELQ